MSLKPLVTSESSGPHCTAFIAIIAGPQSLVYKHSPQLDCERLEVRPCIFLASSHATSIKIPIM